MVIAPALTQKGIMDIYMYSTVLMERDIRLNLPHQKFPAWLTTSHLSLLHTYPSPSPRTSERWKTLRAATYSKATASRATGSTWTVYRASQGPSTRQASPHAVLVKPVQKPKELSWLPLCYITLRHLSPLETRITHGSQKEDKFWGSQKEDKSWGSPTARDV